MPEQDFSKPPVLTVSQLTQAIKLSLESTFPNICLQGEISNFKVQTSGHLYFSLKDSQAQISAVMFRADAATLKLMPKGGDQVLVKGDLNVYPSKGNYQLIIRELSYVGLGELLQKLEQLKLKLHHMGWFKATRKKPLPRFPRRIGVVTSPTGAVIQDILNVLSRRFSGFQLVLNPVKVQGEGAAQEIAQAIDQFNLHQLVDVMIVGRGGGSLEDLWAFNEEIVAQAIYRSQIPIISAVGHETDHCIADYVADVRAPTPSAAAEIVIAEKAQQLDYLDTLKKRMQQTLKQHIQKDRYRLERFSRHPLFIHPFSLIEGRMQKVDDFRLEVNQSIQRFLQLKNQYLEARKQQVNTLKPLTRITYFKERLQQWNRTLHHTWQQSLMHKRQQLKQRTQEVHQVWTHQQIYRRQRFNLEQLRRHLQQPLLECYKSQHQKLKNIINLLQARDPRTLLQKGYSILFAEKGPFVINSIHKLKKGQVARLLFADGEALITINEMITREHNTPLSSSFFD